jgi:hydroxypyruvate isomerase
MLRLSANISTLFTEWPLLDRPAAAADAGFRAVEMQFPYAENADALAAACRRADIAMILINLPGGRLDQGELGLACLPDRRAEFHDGVEQAATYAMALGCGQVNCLAGRLPPNLSRTQAWAALVDNARHAADRLAPDGIRLLVEPLNRRDHPDFLLAGLAEADALIAAADHPNLALQYDAYHMRAEGEEWLGELRARAATIGHIQFSDHPGRHEPGSGDMDMAALFAAIEASPYAGWTGAEYRPRGTTLDSLGWLPAAQAMATA